MGRASIFVVLLFAMAATSASAQQAERASSQPFDLEIVEDVLRNAPPAPASGTPSVEPQQTLDDRLSLLTQEHMRRCWRMPRDATTSAYPNVTVQFTLNEDGTLRGRPRIVEPENYAFEPAVGTAVRRALRAVRDCSPYPFATDPIAAEHYERWREMELTFTPPISSASR